MHAAGARVVLVGRREVELAAAVKTMGEGAAYAMHDITQTDQTAALVQKITREHGDITCLVNNASLFENDTPLPVTRELWNAHMEVNLRAPFVLSQEFVRQLPEHRSGNIVNIVDERVWNLTPFFTSYTVSKAGLWTLTQTLALAFAPRVRVNAIGPGPTLPSRSRWAASR